LGIVYRNTETHVTLKESRGTLVDLMISSKGTLKRKNSDNEVIDLARYYSELAKETQSGAKRRK